MENGGDRATGLLPAMLAETEDDFEGHASDVSVGTEWVFMNNGAVDFSVGKSCSKQSVDGSESNEDEVLDFSVKSNSDFGLQSFSMKPTDTKTRQDFNHFIAYCSRTFNVTASQLITVDDKSMDSFIASFLINLKKKDGSLMEPGTIRGKYASVVRHLKELTDGRIDFDMAKGFIQTQKALKTKQTESKADGKGVKASASDFIDEKDLAKMIQAGCIGDNDGLAVQTALFFIYSVYFGLRGRSEHHQLKFGDVKCINDRYLELSERVASQHRPLSSFEGEELSLPRAYATGEYLCPVRMFKLFSDKRPASYCENECPMYLSIAQTSGQPNKPWFKCQSLGVNFIGNLLKSAAEKAGIKDKKITNHSARKFALQTLSEARINSTNQGSCFGKSSNGDGPNDEAKPKEMLSASKAFSARLRKAAASLQSLDDGETSDASSTPSAVVNLANGAEKLGDTKPEFTKTKSYSFVQTVTEMAPDGSAVPVLQKISVNFNFNFFSKDHLFRPLMK